MVYLKWGILLSFMRWNMEMEILTTVITVHFRGYDAKNSFVTYGTLSQKTYSPIPATVLLSSDGAVSKRQYVEDLCSEPPTIQPDIAQEILHHNPRGSLRKRLHHILQDRIIASTTPREIGQCRAKGEDGRLCRP